MKTTDIFVEQVLIGFLVLTTGGLMFLDSLREFADRLPSGMQSNILGQILSGGILVGVAYLVGMVYDRCADTMLQDLEGHRRLRFAMSILSAAPAKDPFPEGKWRILMLASENKATSYGDYLRSRIRLTRALTTILPGMSVSFLLLLTKPAFKTSPGALVWWWLGALSIPIVYSFATGSKLLPSGVLRGYQPPRTSGLEGYEREAANPENQKALRSIWWFIARDTFFWSACLLLATGVLLVILGGLRTKSVGCLRLVSVLLAGAFLTLVTGWTWWRICWTFFRFLYDYQDHRSHAEGAKA